MENFEFGEEIEKDFFVLLQACDKSKKNLSPHVESNLRPSDSLLKFWNHLSSGWLQYVG